MKKYFIYPLLAVLLSASSVFGQLETTKAAFAKASGFSAGDPGIYSGDLESINDVYFTGYTGDSVSIGDRFVDRLGRLYGVVSVSNNTRRTVSIVVEQLGEPPYFKPAAGVGFVCRRMKKDFLPEMPDGNGQISTLLRAMISIHNSKIVSGIGGGTLYQIDSQADTTTIEDPAEGDVALVAPTGILFRDSARWVFRDAGPAGEDGKSLLFGIGPPPDTIGRNGEFYIDTDASRLYGPKVADVWANSTSLIGDQGPKGDPGAGVIIVGTVANADSLDTNYDGNLGDMFITEDFGHGYVWNGVNFIFVGEIRGPQGVPGEDGEDGRGIASTVYDDNTGTVTFTYTDGATYTTPDIRGADGRGITSTLYDPGTGILTITFTDNTTYQTGDLRGEDGVNGQDGRSIVGTSYDPLTGILTITYSDATTFQTDDLRGADGSDGTNGEDGVGIQSTSYDPATGVLTLTLTDGSSYQTGDLRGEQGIQGEQGVPGTPGADGSDGEDGRGIASSSYDPVNGTITLTFTDGATFTTGDLRGADGVDGTNGVDGEDGNGIASTNYDGSTGVLTLTFTDGSTYSTGDLRGEDGATGPPGPGVPAGGLAGEWLRKLSNADFDTEWAGVPFVEGSGTADRIPVWTASNILANSILLQISNGLQLDQGKVFAFDPNNISLPPATRGQLGTITGSLFFSPSNGAWSQIPLSDYFNSSDFNLADFTNIRLSSTGVTAGSYTNANITIGPDGRISSAANGIAGTTNYLDLNFSGTSGLSDGVDNEGITGASDNNYVDFGTSGSNLTATVIGMRRTNSMGFDLNAQNPTGAMLTVRYGNQLSGVGTNLYNGIDISAQGSGNAFQILRRSSNPHVNFRFSDGSGYGDFSRVFHQLDPPDRMSWSPQAGSDANFFFDQSTHPISASVNSPGGSSYNGMYFGAEAVNGSGHFGWQLVGRYLENSNIYHRSINQNTGNSDWHLIYDDNNLDPAFFYSPDNPPPSSGFQNPMVEDLITGNFLIRNAEATGSELRMQTASVNIQPTGTATSQYIFNDEYFSAPNATTAPTATSFGHITFVMAVNEYGETKIRKFLRKNEDIPIGQGGVVPVENDRFVMESDYYRRNKVLTSTEDNFTTTADPAAGIDDLAFSGIPAGRYRYTATIYHSKDAGASTARSDFEFAISGSFDAINLHWSVEGENPGLMPTRHANDSYTGTAYPSTDIYKTTLRLDVEFTSAGGSITPEIEGEITAGGNDFINVHENSSSTLERL